MNSHSRALAVAAVVAVLLAAFAIGLGLSQCNPFSQAEPEPASSSLESSMSSAVVSSASETPSSSAVSSQAAAEAQAKAKAEAEAKQKAEAEAKQKAEAEEKAKKEKEAKQKAEAEAKAKAEQEAKQKAEEERAKAEAEQRAKAEAEAQKALEEAKAKAEEEARAAEKAAEEEQAHASAANLSIAEDYRAGFVHGDKGAEHQKYIIMHDTEGDTDAYSTIGYWDSNGAGVAAHFIVNKDGSIVQCVPLDKITHHAGFGDAGHNAAYGVEDESRDDKVGTVPIGDWAPDYGMNSYSVGIEMVHVGGSGYYPEEQLAALDALIAYIDSYYGFQSTIIDHKAWRSGNSDTSPEFAGYLANYQDHRTHN